MIYGRIQRPKKTMKRAHTEDISTDISCANSSALEISSPVKGSGCIGNDAKKMSEADKQILKWAGKLELESCDLREKSSLLIGLLKRNSKELVTVIDSLTELTLDLKNG